MKIHHIGYAVKNIETSSKELAQLGYKRCGDIVQDDHRQVEILFMQLGEYQVELVAPKSEASPVNNILKKVGDGPYHVCYSTDDIAREMAELQGNGFLLVEPIAPAPAISNKNVCFLFKKGVGIIELVEE